METSLHRELKYHYAVNGDSVEVSVDGYRIDAIDDQGALVEIQHAGIGAIRNKVAKLLEADYVVRVVKPIIEQKWIETLEKADGPVIRRRKSPKHSEPLDIFRELIHFTRVFPHPNLTVETVNVHCIEQRVARVNKRWRRKQYRVIDQSLAGVGASDVLATANDLWRLLGYPKLPSTFDTQELAEAIGRPRWVAQQIAYTLNRCDGAEACGKRGNAIIYKLRNAEPPKPSRKSKRAA